ncbi:hypothetical protein ABB37_02351 [Leptomonas pyrrhocoris]|uniref:RRM domain-containing protein n=1 Tax=Leptomonas pyrrhocoris TaxID=157538 RepID=A0A0N0VGT7_LEPPY|nr:hypothetical protein ABB37_02351 [Leptomonas pyrrhocoris]XP_015662794.1 hypothetical protein ABB37_02351 [Leptomonas pyrrhocoris]KPA84354.1 hypothetical protein ABB37_02351 [Leptomonas pyrrhocoris]KPA84355.1 hypothetical protein ABB37_02351 [Leptomonas pyrrhocoris]|eukprot:XP_015662793.1 hypothetical protein ABB37_02351 [Leptomonas pyrrhocoris]
MTSLLADVSQWYQQQQQQQPPLFNQWRTPGTAQMPVDPWASEETYGVVWFGHVPPKRFFEMTPYFLSLEEVRRDDEAAAEDTDHVKRLDVNFFVDGPYAGQGFVCLTTPHAARELVRRFPCSIMVGQFPRFSITLRLSSIADLYRAQCNYACKREVGRARSPTPPVPQKVADTALAAEEAEDGNTGEPTLIHWLRGLPFETTEADLAAFLKPIEGRVRSLRFGRLSTGECSGNVFVELNSLADRSAIMQLHNVFFPVAAHEGLAPQLRPKPRYVEVIPADAERRDAQLEKDSCTSRTPSGKQQKSAQHGMLPALVPSNDAAAVARKKASRSSGALAPMGSASLVQTAPSLAPPHQRRHLRFQQPLPSQQQHQQQQQQQQQTSFYSCSLPSMAPPQQYGTMGVYAQSPSTSIPPTFQRQPQHLQLQHQRPQHQQLQQLSLFIQPTQQVAYLLPQQQPEEQQQQCCYVIQNSPIPAQQLLMNSSVFPSFNMAVNANNSPTISIFSVNPSSTCFNGGTQPAGPETQQTLALAQFPFFSFVPTPSQPQQQQRFFVVSNDQNGFHPPHAQH